MRIAGMQKLTLLDYPGHTAATVFTAGCNLRCPFCHNGELTGAVEAVAGRAEGGSAPFPETPVEDALAFLRTRRGLLDGVCISGGEPLLQPGLADFCRAVKGLGFAVKLDTNGTLPDRLRALLDAGLVDFVAMDVKNAPSRYAETTGVADLGIAPVLESMRLLMAQDPSTGASYEFRTTVVEELHAREDLIALARWLADEARASEAPQSPPWFIQNFKDSDTVLAGEDALHPWGEDGLRALLPRLREILPTAQLRGIEERG